MKTYTLATTLTGVLSDDCLYFEGVPRPQAFFALRDAPHEKLPEEMMLELERYWNDMYNLFLRKLTHFASTTPFSDEESVKLLALLQELIRIKNLIENDGRADIM